MTGELPSFMVVTLPMRWRRTSDAGLSPEARARVDKKIADVNAALRHAQSTSHSYVIGGVANPKDPAA